MDILSKNIENDKRSVGRPEGSGTRGQKAYSGKVDVRLSSEEDGILNRLADLNGVTRSDVMRKALLDFYKFNSED